MSEDVEGVFMKFHGRWMVPYSEHGPHPSPNIDFMKILENLGVDNERERHHCAILIKIELHYLNLMGCGERAMEFASYPGGYQSVKGASRMYWKADGKPYACKENAWCLNGTFSSTMLNEQINTRFVVGDKVLTETWTVDPGRRHLNRFSECGGAKSHMLFENVGNVDIFG